MKCPKCKGLTILRANTGHESVLDQAAGTVTRVRICKDAACAKQFKTHERLDTEDAELRRKAFLFDMHEAKTRRAQEQVRELGRLITQRAHEIAEGAA